jgi:hypothetical protein
MAHRELTSDETAVLAHVVVDPDGWWLHCEENFKGDPEVALVEKLAKHKSSHEDAVAAGDYKTRAELEAEMEGPP